MGDTLTLLLLGTPELAVGGAPLGIRSAKTRALLCYLATTPGARSRAELAALLWGERPDANARGSLRLALSELRREVGGWLDITRDHVGFRADDSCFVDYWQLTRAPTVADALRLWRGEFLDGFSFGDAPAFASWLESERRRTRLLLRELLVRSGASASEHVVRLARIVTELDPFDEEAHRLLIASLARAGNRAAALACYEELRRRLANELGVDPSPETRALRQDLAPRPPAARRAPLPVPASELIGRESDIRRLRSLLSRERMITLLGLGGIGKTRLAIAAAEAVEHDAAFVSFAGVRPDAAVTTLARRLGVDLSPPRPAVELLLAALTGRSMLLVLDNLEHLPSFDPVIGDILRAAPGVRVLATSRRRLEALGQVIVQVEGLPGPAAEALFAARALKAQPGFDPDREAPLVAAICTATGGLPLAIELAASLLRAIPCADLAERLGVDPGLLSTGGPAVRARHASMRTVFETSWQLLEPAGQEALAALSVFGGGCTLAAALEVARTTPEVLVRLVDQSMIHFTPSGRYAIHPLIQQLAAAHLKDPLARERHAFYFARLLDRHAMALQDGSDAEVTRVLGAEMDNIRLAWPVSGQAGFLDHYWTLCLRLRLYEESVAIVRRHLAHTPEAPHLRARRLRMAAVSEHQLAREREATRLAGAALDTLGEPLPTSPAGLAAAFMTAAARQAAHRLLRLPRTDAAGAEAAQALALLARIAYHQQDLPRMLVASLRQLNAAERTADPALKAEAYAYVATAARIAGRHRLAARYGTLADHALASVEHPSDAENRARLARGIDQLYSGGFEDARRSLTEGRVRTLDPRMAESCVGMLAETALWRGDFAAAADLFAKTEELAVARVGDDIGRHWCLMGRAEALLRLDEVPVERVRKVVAAARASVERRRTHEKELGLRDGPGMRAIQDLRLLTASARLEARQEPCDDGPTRARSALAEALVLAARLPSAQPGMLECWTGLAELLWSISTDHPGADGRSPVRQDRAAARLLYAHLSRYLVRNPGTAARIGWARSLLLAATGRRKAALRAAERAMADAARLDAPYDHRRAELLARRFGSHA
ncbi:DNA-binding SARP family transcriptional activator [Nonomuraea polychroma]|uniref:DNA-binding SARP family transcriptional activator n=1 Tax=Nonomuraea polychroma TaxID=46176 RepID=A0A438MJG4_9ACTN|nr:BTAD domain-containing putative transcriptional regulator [Nonomuraea polychroma]RVX45595.1 DNA-binding SARP family transcriptional activator [Nonomuraea polychroma]